MDEQNEQQNNLKTGIPAVSPINPALIKIPKQKPKQEVQTPSLPQTGSSEGGLDNSVITVVRDPNHTLGKTFSLNPDGTISKKAAVSLSLGIAVTLDTG
jgi:hypothetical protein